LFQVLLKETAGLPRDAALVQFGVPLPKGMVFDNKKLSVTTDEGIILASDITTSVVWSDNSIKWCLVKARVNLDKNETLRVTIAQHPDTQRYQNPCSELVHESENRIRIHTKNCVFELDKDRFNFIDKVFKQGKCVTENGRCSLHGRQFGHLDPEISSYWHHTSYSSDDALSIELTMGGSFRSRSGEPIANFETTLLFDVEADRVKCDFTLHNPRPAKHVSGLWDLGDPNSLMFDSLDLALTLKDITAINWKTTKDQPWNSLQRQPITIYQESSGGENWNSPNHKDRHNRVPYTLDGFECRHEDSVVHSGKRASPGLRIITDSNKVCIFIEKFWQNCPKSLVIDNNQINIGLFPQEFSGKFELQPGEKKTHSFYISFSSELNELEHIENPIEVTLNPAWVEKSGAFLYFDTDISADPIHNIINEGLTGNNSFFDKREVVDEYGWRNFGDLYADHETEGYQGNEIFVSHYNNQYDPIYGFLRQYALTGNRQWFELADDLANHVNDIDIYHTSHDKDEYNGGLFWHTDHYLDAGTSSHRSFSKYQESSAYIGHAHGGGPGVQHCYTTGLLYHYLLTGNDASRRSVLQLADWVTNAFEGSGTLLSTLLSVRNRKRAGFKNIATGQYPLDRGTGNYINALLDKFILTQQPSTLRRIEHIIKHTVHPLDDIHERNLGEVETNWFYTVFLQSLCRYLQIKEEMSNLDDSFYYARDSLLHYADWMVEHEYAYLLKPEILEFPNHTWTAQDIRKVNILLFARYYSSSPSSRYLAKANNLYNYIINALSSEKSRDYTRILAILMQNHGVISYFKNFDRSDEFQGVKNYEPQKRHNRFHDIQNITIALFSAMKTFSLKQELLWLSHRSEVVAKLLRSLT
jgi:hypothetical protein